MGCVCVCVWRHLPARPHAHFTAHPPPPATPPLPQVCAGEVALVDLDPQGQVVVLNPARNNIVRAARVVAYSSVQSVQSDADVLLPVTTNVPA